MDKTDLAVLALSELAANKKSVSDFLNRNDEVQDLCNSVLLDDETHQIQVIEKILATGITIDDVYEFFLPEAAALLGIYWEESKVSFSQVSLGSQRLQKLARIFEKNYLGNFYSFGPGPDVMLILPERELPMLGVVLAAGMFSKVGANPSVAVGRPLDLIFEEIRVRDFSLIGISLVNKEKLSEAIEIAASLKKQFKKLPIILGTKIDIIELDSKELKIFDLITPSPKEALNFSKPFSHAQ